MKRFLYQYKEDFGRMGTLSGRMRLTADQFRELMGKSTFVHDALGKHSAVQANFDEDTVKLVTDNAAFLALADVLGIDLSCGFDICAEIWLDERIQADERAAALETKGEG